MKDIFKYIVPYLLLIIVIFTVKWLNLETENLIISGSIGLFLAHYIRIDNPHPTLLQPLSLSVFAYCFLWGITDYLGWSTTILNIALCLIVVLYSIRFLKRADKRWIDYLKILAVIAGVIAILISDKGTPTFLSFLIFIYLLDRLIIRKQMKKTTQIIVFSLLALVCITFVIFGQIKANEAYKNAEAAKLAQQEAQQVVDMARQQAQEAAAHARKAEAEALMQKELADRALVELQECIAK